MTKEQTTLSNRQKLVLIVGCTGIALNAIGVISGTRSLNFWAVFLGRLASLLFTSEIDKFRWYYLAPITLNVINLSYQLEELIFVEYMLQSIFYQWAAFNCFKTTNGRRTNQANKA